MRKIRRLGSIGLVFFILLGTVSCTSADINRTTQDFFKAADKGQYDKAAAFVNLPGGSCLGCHNEVKSFAEVMAPGQLAEVNVKNLEVDKKNKLATGDVEFTTALGRTAKTIGKVTFVLGEQGNWQINYRQIARATMWRFREPVFAGRYEDIPNTPRPEEKTKVTYELTLPNAGQIIPITDNPLKASEKDAKPHVFWSNSINVEPGKVTFSPTVIAFKPDNEDPAVGESEGTFAVGGWLINNSEQVVTRLSNIRLRIMLDQRVLGRLVIVEEKTSVPPGHMQYKEYVFKSEVVDLNTNLNKAKCIYEFSPS